MCTGKSIQFLAPEKGKRTDPQVGIKSQQAHRALRFQRTGSFSTQLRQIKTQWCPALNQDRNGDKLQKHMCKHPSHKHYCTFNKHTCEQTYGSHTPPGEYTAVISSNNRLFLCLICCGHSWTGSTSPALLNCGNQQGGLFNPGHWSVCFLLVPGQTWLSLYSWACFWQRCPWKCTASDPRTTSTPRSTALTLG